MSLQLKDAIWLLTTSIRVDWVILCKLKTTRLGLSMSSRDWKTWCADYNHSQPISSTASDYEYAWPTATPKASCFWVCREQSLCYTLCSVAACLIKGICRTNCLVSRCKTRLEGIWAASWLNIRDGQDLSKGKNYIRAFFWIQVSRSLLLLKISRYYSRYGTGSSKRFSYSLCAGCGD